jgi:hypothetical protein
MSDSEEEYENDELLRIDDERSADAYIKSALDSMSPEERERVFRAFLFGVSGKPRSGAQERRNRSFTSPPIEVQVQAGGADKSNHDMFYDLLQLEDSFHDDFADFDDRVTPDIIMTQLGVILPVITKTRKDPVTGEVRALQEIMLLEEMHGPENTFIPDITGTPELRFGDNEPMVNPLFGRNFEQGMFSFDPEGGTVDAQYANKPAPCKDCVNAEIWCRGEHNMKNLKYEQIAAVSGEIRNFFGSHLVFVVDESIPVTRLVLGIEPIYKSFLKSYRIEDMDRIGQTTRDWTRGEAEWRTMCTKFIYSWYAVNCDAGIMDSGDHAFPMHRRPTGNVFREKADVQVKLLGCDDNNVASYELTSGDTRKDTIKCTLYKKSQAYSKGRMHEAALQNLLNGKSIAVPLAQKRAGDWGQIEHCKRYGCVFVTADKPAVMYAMYRDVCVIYVKTWKTETEVAEEYGDVRDLYRHSFALYGTEKARSELTIAHKNWMTELMSRVRPDGSVFRGGGSTVGYWPLILVTVASAIVQSALGI